MPFYLFGGVRRRAQRMRYLSRLPWRQRLGLFAAVACTFSTLAFVTDLTRLDTPRSHFAVLAAAAVNGLVACGYLASALHGWRWLPLALVVQLAFTWGMNRIYAAARRGASSPLSPEQMLANAQFDALALMFAIIVSYVLFIRFISGMGMRQVRLDTEMKLAQDIHAHLVPPIARRTRGLEFVGRSLPSSEVGGDLLDVIEKDGAVVALVADVSGHGVQAGTLMAMVRSAARVRAVGGSDLPGLFGALDDMLIELGRPDKFVTAAALRFGRSASGAIAWAGAPVAEAEAMLAGHLPILVVRAATGAIERIKNQRPPLGLPRPASVARVRYGSGDLFAILTDGLTEVADGKGAHLGLEEIERVLVARRGEPLGAIADAVFERTRGHGVADDDRTLLLIRAT